MPWKPGAESSTPAYHLFLRPASLGRKKHHMLPQQATETMQLKEISLLNDASWCGAQHDRLRIFCLTQGLLVYTASQVGCHWSSGLLVGFPVVGALYSAESGPPSPNLSQLRVYSWGLWGLHCFYPPLGLTANCWAHRSGHHHHLCQLTSSSFSFLSHLWAPHWPARCSLHVSLRAGVGECVWGVIFIMLMVIWTAYFAFLCKAGGREAS